MLFWIKEICDKNRFEMDKTWINPLHRSECPRRKDVVNCCSLLHDAAAIFVDGNCGGENWLATVIWRH